MALFQFPMMRILTIAAIALAFSAAKLCATEYYIDYLGGADTNGGTSADSAWQHCPGDTAAAANAAAVTLNPGDVVRFKGGVTYVLNAAAGIALRWDGAPGRPITYDGNSGNTWGSGRARITDNHQGNGLTAFSSTGQRRSLVFTTLEIGPVGGAAALPADGGSGVPPKFGGGIAFGGGAVDVTIEDCAFRELGYWFNQQPMKAESIAGAAITSANSEQLKVSRCSFSRMATGLDFKRAVTLDRVTLSECTFGESMVWQVDLPRDWPDGGGAGLKVNRCEVAADTAFERSSWRGYGESPRTTVTIVGADSAVTWVAGAIAAPAPQYQWRKNGVPIAGATNATLRLERVAMGDDGIYTAVASNASGETLSNSALLVVLPGSTTVPGSGGVTPTVPTGTTAGANDLAFTVQPASQLVTAGATATLAATAAGAPTPAYQWWKNGVALNGATGSTLTIANVTTNDVGEYYVVATSGSATATSRKVTVALPDTAPTTVTPPPTVPPTITYSNPATGAAPTTVLAQFMTTGESAATVEFTVSGAAPRPVLVRAVGPTLAAFHLVGVLADPQLELFAGGASVANNDNWGGGDALVSAMSQLPVFPIADGGSTDAAVLLTLAPGTYRVVVTGKAGGQGLVWIDVHEF